MTAMTMLPASDTTLSASSHFGTSATANASPSAPIVSAEVASNALLCAFKTCLEEVDSYIVTLEGRVKCEEDYTRALRQSLERSREQDVKLDARIAVLSSSHLSSSPALSSSTSAPQLPGMRRAWKGLQDDAQRQIHSRSHYIHAIKAHTISPLRAFHDAQDRIRRRIKEDIKSSLLDYEEMRMRELKRIKRNYDRACETLDQLKAQQLTLNEQMTSSPNPPVTGVSGHTSDGGSNEDASGHPDADQFHRSVPSTFRRSLSPRRSAGHQTTAMDSRPPSSGLSHGSRLSSDRQDNPETSDPRQVSSDYSTGDSSSAVGGTKKNAGTFFESLRHRDTWDTARKDVAKKTNALITKIKEGPTSPMGSGSGNGNHVGWEREQGAIVAANSTGGLSSGGIFSGVTAVGSGVGDLGANLLARSGSVTVKSTQSAQQLAVKISKAKRDAQEADKLYRRAIFDVETLALRRERTLAAARTSVIACHRELAIVCSHAWLSLSRNWQTLATTESSLALHFGQEILQLGGAERLNEEVAALDIKLPAINLASDDGPVPYVNFWHGECRSLLFGVSLVDYDCARSQRRAPQLSLSTSTPAVVEPPLIVRKCVSFIESHGLSTPGIYRLSAKHTTVQQLCAAFEKDEERFQFREGEDEPVAVAGVLKQWLREMPNAVMPMPRDERIKITHSLEEQLQNGFALLKGRIRRLPLINQVTLKTIIEHLAIIASNSAVNLMTAKNLSVVFGPVLLTEASDSSGGSGLAGSGGLDGEQATTSLAAAMEEDSVCEILITYSRDIFDNLERAGAPVLPPLPVEISSPVRTESSSWVDEVRSVGGDASAERNKPEPAHSDAGATDEERYAAAGWGEHASELGILRSANPTNSIPLGEVLRDDTSAHDDDGDAGTPTAASERPLVPPGTSASTTSGLKRTNAVVAVIPPSSTSSSNPLSASDELDHSHVDGHGTRSVSETTGGGAPEYREQTVGSSRRRLSAH